MHEQFGRYILQERIAIGGMAEIFKAKAPGLGGFEKILAIKRLHPRYSEDADFIEMLIDEARISVELSHSNIAQIFDLGKVEDHYFIAMEFIDGRDLYRTMKRLKDRRLQFPIDGAAWVAAECAAGLDYAHRKKDSRGRPLNIIHRDISPQNVLLSYEGEAKLVDFGIAKAALRAYETESGIIKGKFYYMSPEQARGEPLDHRTDVFSLGIVLYEMLTGELLYKDEDDASLLSRVRKADIAPPSLLRPEIPPTLERVVMKTLSRDREDRYPSALHLQKDLHKFLRTTSSAFGKARLGKVMREIFLDETGPDESEDLDQLLIRSRAEFGLDGASLISQIALEEAPPPSEATWDGEEPTQDVTAAQQAHPQDFPIAPARGEKSELIVIDSREIHLVDEEKSTLNMDGPPPEAAAAFDSIEVAGPPADLDFDPFEDESTNAVSIIADEPAPPPARRRPEPEPRRAEAPARGRREAAPVQSPRASPEAIAFAAAPTPVPERPARPAPRERERPRPAEREPRSSADAVVPTDPPKEPGGHSIHRPVRQRRAGSELPTAAGGLMPPGPPASFLTRERLLFGSVVLLVLIGAAVLTTLLLRPAGPAPALEPATVSVGSAQGGQGTVVIRSFPSGANVRVDKAYLGETTPTRTVLPAGRPARISIKLGDGYEVYETEIIPEVGRETIIDAQLVKIRGVLTVDSSPGGATVFIEGRDRGRTPCTISDLAVERPIRVKLLRDGFQPYDQLVEWNGRREMTLDIRLDPLSAELPRVAALDSRERSRRQDDGFERRAEPPVRRSPPPQRAAPPPERRASGGGGGGSGGRGTLTVMAAPWGKVYVNDREVAAETPLIKYPLASGTHRVHVLFQGSRSDKSPVKQVLVEPGADTRVKFTR
ncbi:protein kinase [Myxococcota bacterium]|nr:protein kinase [Myxococcota bacterium]